MSVGWDEGIGEIGIGGIRGRNISREGATGTITAIEVFCSCV